MCCWSWNCALDNVFSSSACFFTIHLNYINFFSLICEFNRHTGFHCPKHWSNKPLWLTTSHGARCQTPQLYFRTHCQDVTHCPSSSGSTLSSQVVTRSTTRLVVEASSRSPQQAMAGLDSRWQQPSTRWRVERCCQTRSFWSDATVHADLATMTTN